MNSQAVFFLFSLSTATFQLLVRNEADVREKVCVAENPDLVPL